MKKTSLIIALTLLTLGAFAQGIEFEHSTFDEALAKAKKENKVVFMDCYTAWCSPCKALAKTIFPQKSVGDYFNKNFVSIKMDMEKGEGVALAKKYNVTAFPTLLFLDTDGEVLHLIIGFAEADVLIEEAKTAVDPNKSFGSLDKRYKAGERNSEFLTKYVTILNDNGMYDEMDAVAKEYNKNLKPEQLLDPAVVSIVDMLGLKYASEGFYFLVKNKESFVAVEGLDEEIYDGLLSDAISNHLWAFTEMKSIKPLLSQFKTCKADYVCSNQEWMEYNMTVEYYYMNEKFEEWFNFQKDKADAILASETEMAQRIYMNILYDIAMDEDYYKDAELFERTLKMGEELIARDADILDSYYCMAYIYSFVDNDTQSLKNITKYIDMCKAEGDTAEKDALDLQKKLEAK